MLVFSPMFEFLTSTKFPARTLSASTVCGRRCENGPNETPLPITDSSHCEAFTVLSFPTVQPSSRLQGPTVQLVPIFVLPRMIVFGKITVPTPISQLSAIITPSAQGMLTPFEMCLAMICFRVFSSAQRINSRSRFNKITPLYCYIIIPPPTTVSPLKNTAD